MLKAAIQNEATAIPPNKFKLRSFRNALSLVNQVKHPILTLNDLKDIQGIGKGISRRIEKTLLENSENASPEVQEQFRILKIKNELKSIRSLGEAKADKLIAAGCNGLSDLKKRRFLSMLSPMQQVYACYGHHLNELILQEEVELVADFVRDHLPTGWESFVIGLHRRQSPKLTSQMDVLIIHPHPEHSPLPEKPLSKINPKAKPTPFQKVYISDDDQHKSPLYNFALPLLRRTGLIADDLTFGERSWEGVIRLPKKDNEGRWIPQTVKRRGSFRRLILRSAPVKTRGAALIAYTGDDELLKSLRVRALKAGMYFDEAGLWKWHVDDQPSLRENPEAYGEQGFWGLLDSSTEEEVFEQLGLDWIDPTKRNFKNLSS